MSCVGENADWILCLITGGGGRWYNTMGCIILLDACDGESIFRFGEIALHWS